MSEQPEFSDDDMLIINEDDIVEVADIPNGNSNVNDSLTEDVAGMDLENDQDDNNESDNDAEGAQAEEIMDEIKDNADIVFSHHKDSVFCVSVDPCSCDLAVTGGQDDTAFVWKISTGEIIFQCTGHRDSVTCVSFSHDGAFVATADLSGLIKVWKVATQTEVWSFECSDVEWLHWHSSTNVLFAGTVDGDSWMWKIPGGDCRTFQSFGCTATTGHILPDGKRMIVGYEDGAVREWELKTGNVLNTYTGNNGHKGSVVCLDSHRDNALFLSGSTDVTAKLWNSTNGKAIATFNCSGKQKQFEAKEDSVEAVGFSNTQNYAATGTLSGVLSIWDIPNQLERQCCTHQAGVVKLKWASDSPLVYTCSLDGTVRLWDARNGKMESQWFGHQAEILDFALTRNGKHILTVSEDKTARVFSLHTPDR